MTRSLIAAALLLLAACGASAQTPPLRPADIPAFPGATRIENAEVGEEDEGLMDPWSGEPLAVRRLSVATYRSTATPEEVYAFYLARLGGQETWDDEDVNPFPLSPGGTTRVIRGHAAHSLDDGLGMGSDFVPGAQKRRALQAGRRPHAPDEWLREGGFDWMVKEASGEITSLSVHVIDEGLAPRWEHWTPNTVVVISARTFAAPAEDHS